MIRRVFKFASFLLLAFLFACLFLNGNVWAQAQSLVMEAEQHWETYGTGGTCIPGTHNLAVSDVDCDGSMEMITGGYAYTIENGTVKMLGAPFKIWSWSGPGHNLTLKKSESWPGGISCVYAGDADGDGAIEILTSGYAQLSTRANYSSYSALSFWNWDGNNLVLRGSYEGHSVSSIFIGDVDDDTKPEVVTVGQTLVQNKSVAQLSIWNWEDNNLTLRKRAEWIGNDGAQVTSVYAGDLNNDGSIEIVTTGFVNQPTNSSGQLRVWVFDGAEISLKAAAEWRTAEGYAVDVTGNNIMGNTMAYKIKVSDVDGDGYPEIITGGFTYDGENASAQLRIWNWTGQDLNAETNYVWQNLGITELKSISIDDVDEDGKEEIVTSGLTAGKGSWAADASDKTRAELKVWNWDGNSLTIEQNETWIIGEGVAAWNLGTGDLNNDGDTEIVSVGCMYTNNLCDPDLRIWNLQTAPGSFPFTIIFASGLVAAALIVGALFLARRKR